MTATVLEQARAAGVELWTTPEGALRWRSPTPLPEDLRQSLVAHKAELLALLRPAPPREQAEAERLLAELRAEVEQIKADFAGDLPTPLANLLADGLAIAEGYIVNHEAEASRGWDALDLLRGMAPIVRSWVEFCGRAQERGSAMTGWGTNAPQADIR